MCQWEAEGELLNTLGMAQIALGQVDEGTALPAPGDRRSRATTTTSTASAYAYANLADHAQPPRPDASKRSRCAREGLADSPASAASTTG